MSTQEKRRLERLKKELDSQQRKLDSEKRKYQHQLKGLKAEQSKIAAQKRELNTKIKKFHLQRKEAASVNTKQNKKHSGGNTGIERKLRQEIKDLKSKSETTKKQLRESRIDLDAANDEIKILKRKIKHTNGPSQSNLNERKIKQARREIYNMKRRLKMAMYDLDKQAKYYESQLRRFKLDEQKWINRQREISKEKNIVIKHVFIDDIQKLKVYKDQHDKVRISTFEGSEITVKNIEVTNVAEYDVIADEVVDKLMQEIELEFGKKKKRNKLKLRNTVSSNSSYSPEKKTKAKKKQNNPEVAVEDIEDNKQDNDVNAAVLTPISKIFGDNFDEMYDDVDIDEDFIDGCFNELMKEICERSHDLNKLNTNEDIEVLLQNIKARHDEIQQKLTQMQYEYVDEIPEMNKKWQDEVYKLMEHDNEDMDGGTNDRKEMFEKVIAVLNNEQPTALLDEIIEHEENQEWKLLFTELSQIKMNAFAMQDVRETEMDGNELVLCHELMTEMRLREADLQCVRKLNEADLEPQEESDNILESVRKRHVMSMEKIKQIIDTTQSEEDKQDGNGADLVENVSGNNVVWEEDLVRLIKENKEYVLNRKQNQYNSDELNGRIADLLKLIEIYNVSKSTKIDLKNLRNNFNSLVGSIVDRHEYNHKQNTYDVEAVENDKDWKDNILGLVCSMTGFKVSDVREEDAESKQEMEDAFEFEMKEWWLDKDENRNDTIDEITVDEQQQCGELYEAAMYLTRLLYIADEKEEEENDVITSLYFPIPCVMDEDNQPNKHNIIASFYDGVILCKLINKIKSDYIDERVVHVPNAFNPFPINDDCVCDNTQLIISCAQSLGIQLQSYEFSECVDAQNWCQYVIDLINALSVKYINDRICLRKHKELVRIVKNNEEDADELRKVTGQQWLHRWINYVNNKAVLGEIKHENYNNELFAAMMQNENENEIEEFNISAAELLINKYANISNVECMDLCNNNMKLQDLFTADLFEYSPSTLDKLSDAEKAEYKILLKGSSSKSRSDIDRFTRWINTALSPNITIINLLKDLSSGYILLKLINKSKPDCVLWRNVRKKIRHKFDSVNNCNMVMKICENELGFSLVGMAGSDIVDLNQKFIISLLSQLMRYYQTRELSLLLFKNTVSSSGSNKKQKAVSDNDILQWVNLKINDCADAQSKAIMSFKDRVLSTCIFYIELLKAVKTDCVDLLLCNYNVKPLVNNKVMDKQKKDRLGNARLVLTLIRRLGGELFVTSSHLCTMENKAILAVFAAIMTISITDTKK